MKNRRPSFRLSRLFKNNKFLIIISLVISISVWVAMSFSDSNETTATISNIPIQITLSDDAVDNGLQIFTGNDQTASVTVSGNRLAIGSISADDIVISAPTAGTIATSGNYALSLTAKKLNQADRFEITSTVSPSVINIFVDQLKEQTFNVVNKITYKVSDGYHASFNPSATSVTVSGPKTEVDKVASVGIVGEIKGELKDNASLDCDVKLYDNSGGVISSNLLTLSDDTITANFSVLPYKEVPIKIACKNKPDGLNIDDYATIIPDKIKIAAKKDVLDKLESVSTSAVDFSTISNESYDLEVDLDIPSNCTNISNTDSVDVKINLSSFTKKTLKVKKDIFEVKNLSSEYSYSIATDSLNVTLVGPKSELADITSSDILCEIDASSIEKTTGSISLPATFTVSGDAACWAYGKYEVNISINE